MNDNKLEVQVMGGNKLIINVIDIVEMADNDKKYIVYTIDNSGNDDMFVSILNESDKSYSLDTIDDENELRMVEEYLIKVNSEG